MQISKPRKSRPYRKTIPLDKNCQECGAPIFSNRRDRAAQAIACSHACLRKLMIKRLKTQPRNLRKEKHVGTGGYVFLNIRHLAPEDQVLARAMTRAHYIQEHRLVVARRLQRPLLRHETVHHLDGNKVNNTAENLELWVAAPHSGVRSTDLLCPHCGKTYG